MHQSFSEFLRSGGEGEFLLRKTEAGIVGRRLGWSVKNTFPDYEPLRGAFEDRLANVADENAAMLVEALAGAYDPPLEPQDLPDVDYVTRETLDEWDRRLGAIWAEWNTHSQRLRPVRQAMEESLLRSYAGLVNEVRQRDLGIERYVWQTVGDDRVRAGHSARDGGVYRWDSEEEHPGQAPNCRCSARPIPPGADVVASGPLSALESFLGGLGNDFEAGLGVRPQSFIERLLDNFMPESGVTIDGEMLGVQAQGDLAVAFLELGDAIKGDPEGFLRLLERHGDGFERLSAVFGITDPRALAAAAVLARSGAPEELIDRALTQSRSTIDRLTAGTAFSLVDLALAVRSIPDLRWEDVRRTLETVFMDPSSLAEAAIEPFKERIAVGDYAGALGYGLPEVVSGVAALGRLRRRAEALPEPLRITREMLDEQGTFEGFRNAGPNAPLFVRWLERGRGLELSVEGHFRYTSDVRVDGRMQTVSVDYPDGYPDFTPFLDHPSGVRSIEIASTNKRPDDNKLANAAAGHPEWGDKSPEGWTWHHHQDGRTMQLVPRPIHQRYTHRGGIAQSRGSYP